MRRGTLHHCRSYGVLRSNLAKAAKGQKQTPLISQEYDVRTRWIGEVHAAADFAVAEIGRFRKSLRLANAPTPAWHREQRLTYALSDGTVLECRSHGSAEG